MEATTAALRALRDTPPWDWPDGTAGMLLDVLRDDRAAEPDLLLAAELAGDFTVIDDELAGALLSLLRDGGRSDEARGRAAISLGPALEHADTVGLDDPDDRPIAKQTLLDIQEALRRAYLDAEIPVAVRRKILEASVRAPQDWHRDAIRAAYASGDDAWRLTAVFCMRFVRGFEAQILEALDSENADVRYEAILAAGTWQMDAAWPHVAAVVTAEETDKELLLAAIDAAASIRPDEAPEILDALMDSDDEEIVAAVHEALAMAEGALDDDEDDEFDDEDDPR